SRSWLTRYLRGRMSGDEGQGRQDSNLQPAVLETAALPIELRPFGRSPDHPCRSTRRGPQERLDSTVSALQRRRLPRDARLGTVAGRASRWTTAPATSAIPRRPLTPRTRSRRPCRTPWPPRT